MQIKSFLNMLIGGVAIWLLIGCSQVYDRLKLQNETQPASGNGEKQNQMESLERTTNSIPDRSQAFEEQQPSQDASRISKPTELHTGDGSALTSPMSNTFTQSNSFQGRSSNAIRSEAYVGNLSPPTNTEPVTLINNLEKSSSLDAHNKQFTQIRDSSIENLLNKK